MTNTKQMEIFSFHFRFNFARFSLWKKIYLHSPLFPLHFSGNSTPKNTYCKLYLLYFCTSNCVIADDNVRHNKNIQKVCSEFWLATQVLPLNGIIKSLNNAYHSSQLSLKPTENRRPVYCDTQIAWTNGI